LLEGQQRFRIVNPGAAGIVHFWPDVFDANLIRLKKKDMRVKDGVLIGSRLSPGRREGDECVL
jgi:hypothetical protein